MCPYLYIHHLSLHAFVPAALYPTMPAYLHPFTYLPISNLVSVETLYPSASDPRANLTMVWLP